jgi:hypothetical protein
MDKSEIFQDLSIYLFNRIGRIKKGEENPGDSIYKVLSYGRKIPPKARELIPDRRYHKEFPVIYGFMSELGKIEEPPFPVYFSILKEIAKKMKIEFMSVDTMRLLILHTLIVEYFQDNWEKLYE